MMQQWQYRTVLFEFERDGLLGDRFLDDEQVAAWLNRAGAECWELVSVSDVKEGLLLVLKRPAAAGAEDARETATDTAGKAPRQESFRQRLQQQEQEHIRNLEEQRQEKVRRYEEDLVGDIQIR